MAQTRTPLRGLGDGEPEGATFAFAAFVLAHAECPGGMSEARLDEASLACRCPWCGDAAVFRSAGTGG